jgi:hypothetical protein
MVGEDLALSVVPQVKCFAILLDLLAVKLEDFEHTVVVRVGPEGKATIGWTTGLNGPEVVHSVQVAHSAEIEAPLGGPVDF